MLYILIIVVGFALIGGIVKLVKTRELRSKLGRDVADHELTSISSWIEAERNVDKRNQSTK